VAEFDIVDLSETSAEQASPRRPGGVPGQAAGELLGTVDTAVVAAELESLRSDLAAHVQDSDEGLRLTEVAIKLTLGAEGRVAFVAKGTAEACIEVKFGTPNGKA
jgi:hypothetical protein